MSFSLLYLCDKTFYDTKMSRVRFHSMVAISKIAEVHYSGIGWPDYNTDKTVSDNISTIGKSFDLIVVYKPYDYTGWDAVDIPVCIRYNEMYREDQTLEEIKFASAKLVVCHHKNDQELFFKKYSDHAKFVYIPHSSNSTIFYPDPNVVKDIDVLLIGEVDTSFKGLSYIYPLRRRMRDIINPKWWNIAQKRFSKDYNVVHYKHPGYKINGDPDAPMKAYASIISRAKIVVSCSSKFKYRLGKYIEVPMCCTAYAADLPYEDQDSFNEFLIRIDLSMSDKDIIDKITYYLENDEARLEKVQKGLDWAKGYTQEKYAERFINIIGQFLHKK